MDSRFQTPIKYKQTSISSSKHLILNSHTVYFVCVYPPALHGSFSAVLLKFKKSIRGHRPWMRMEAKQNKKWDTSMRSKFGWLRPQQKNYFPSTLFVRRSSFSFFFVSSRWFLLPTFPQQEMNGKKLLSILNWTLVASNSINFRLSKKKTKRTNGKWNGWKFQTRCQQAMTFSL